MSNYENYSTTADNYDSTREAFGYEVILGMLCAAPGALHEQALLDAGCGTGNYSAALAPFVGRIEAVDVNEQMLAVARGKFTNRTAGARVNIQLASIDALPLESASADAAMLNQVLHHLPVQARWAAHARVFHELARVLRSGGLLSINTCSQEQLTSGFWHYHLAPQASAEIQRRHPSLEVLESLLHAAGFTIKARIVPTSGVIQGAAYGNVRGPLQAEWREGDSFWALCEPRELEAAQARVRQLDAAGELEAYAAEHDRHRPSIGQTTFMFAQKR
ncbi:MAG: class I SAM-dependent methyltransferase [Gammaproteobacteria bacterium]|nr:class I SAM-dependent methyltransferase [Gammaproteobacteria bacterium]